MDGIIECAKRDLKLPAQRGMTRVLEGTLRELLDPGYAAVCGALFESVERFDEEIGRDEMQVFNVGGFLEKTKEWLKDFLP